MDWQFGCDPGKRALLMVTRDIDLLDLEEIFDDPFRIKFEDVRRAFGEARHLVIGMSRGIFVTAVYTIRGNIVWLITAWPSNRKERERYVETRLNHLQNRS